MMLAAASAQNENGIGGGILVFCCFPMFFLAPIAITHVSSSNAPLESTSVLELRLVPHSDWYHIHGWMKHPRKKREG